jgi:hypothetical protein
MKLQHRFALDIVEDDAPGGDSASTSQAHSGETDSEED